MREANVVEWHNGLRETATNGTSVSKLRNQAIHAKATESAETVLPQSEIQEDTQKAVRPPYVPLQFKQRRSIGRALNLEEAVEKLGNYLDTTILELDVYKSGLLRLEVNVPSGGSALQWLKHQEILLQHHLGFYFRERDETRAPCEADQKRSEPECFCGVGHSWLWKGMQHQAPNAELFEAMDSFLDPQEPSIKCMGATRFAWEGEMDEEWEDFGNFVFFIPAVEYCQRSGEDIVACTLVWQELLRDASPFSGCGAETPHEAVNRLKSLISRISDVTSNITLTPSVQKIQTRHTPSEQEWLKLLTQTSPMLKPVKTLGHLSETLDANSALQECLESGQQGLDDLLMAMHASTEVEHEDSAMEQLSKLVLARKTEIEIEGSIHPHSILQYLQDHDAGSYQFCLSLPKGGSFIGSTPERLYLREGTHVTTEAIAGTRPRGPKGNLQKDFLIGLEMLGDPKDHVEFTLVRDWLMEALHSICSRVHVDIPKSVIRKASVQHLYGRLRGDLRRFQSDFEILKALHPTPAVCGRPQSTAKEALAEIEGFDRGYYAGPLGWISGQGAEFVVSIRSGLIKPQTPSAHHLSLYAGVGTVKESNPISEWAELELKVSPFTELLIPRISPFSAPNVNVRMAALMVEELCRSGIQTFAVAPGSRSSPLVYAVASNPNCHIYPCIDERSLGFWSVGYGRATGHPAPIITSSGTAVANLLPSVIEAHLSKIPLLLLTADRPSDLRQTGANQTIDQVKLFGDAVRYFHDIPPPSESDSATQQRALLTMVDAAVRHARGTPSGPVHLNCQFNEPLAPTTPHQKTQHAPDAILEHWWQSGTLFTTTSNGLIPAHSLPNVANQMWQCGRGMLIVGELMTPTDRSTALDIAALLQWPCIVDVLSGLKTPFPENHSTIIFSADQILASDVTAWEALKPSRVVQLGGHLTSKRLMKFLEHCRTTSPDMEWIQVSQDNWRDDPSSLVTHKTSISLPLLRTLLTQQEIQHRDNAFLRLWKAVDGAVNRSLELSMRRLSTGSVMTEPYVAYLLSQMLPTGHGLFLGNGMPIRDMDMFGGIPAQTATSHAASPIRQVGANRGASGIDGVLSTSIGYALGLRQQVTLLVGDVSFLHDSNGLNFLRSETWPPMTVVIINNSGGGIFDFLPIAEAVPSEMYDALWSTPQYINLAALCQAYGVAHSRVTQPEELQSALRAAWDTHQHSVVEVVTHREGNVALHRQIQSMAAISASRAIRLSPLLDSSTEPWIADVSWSHFSLPLKAPLTTGSTKQSRDGVLLKITLQSKSGEWLGLGEVAPLEGLHQETLEAALSQLRYLKHVLCRQPVPWEILMLNGILSDWLDDAFGIQEQDLLPTVRFGLDSALLTALSHTRNVSLHELYAPSKSDSVSVNALVGSLSDPEATLTACQQLLQQGYSCIKIKVGRADDPTREAQAINTIAQRFGNRLKIRLDANQAWTLPQALCFAEALSCPTLEYIEEPLAHGYDLSAFCQKTDLPVALDESLVDCKSPQELIALLQKCKGVVSCVIKPSCIGAVETVVQYIEACTSQKCTAIVSSSFESPIGLAMLSELAAISDAAMEHTCDFSAATVSHGLGTMTWFESACQSGSLMVPSISLSCSWQLLREPSWASDASPCPLQRLGSCRVPGEGGSYLWSYHEVGYAARGEKPALLFLHGFLGSSKDWLPIMHSLSDAYHCLAVDLPGHGNTTLTAKHDQLYHFSRVSEALVQFLKQLEIQPYAIVGYSMGGRLAQQLAVMLDCPKLIVVSGSSGLPDAQQRAARLAQDLQTASLLESGLPMERLVEHWYRGSALWTELRRRERLYRQLCAQRSADTCPTELARALLGLSVGHMPYLAEKLASTSTQTLFLYGTADHKFQRLYHALDRQFPNRFRFVPFGGCSHGLIVEAGVRLGVTVREFLKSF